MKSTYRTQQEAKKALEKKIKALETQIDGSGGEESEGKSKTAVK